MQNRINLSVQIIQMQYKSEINCMKIGSGQGQG